MLALVGAGLEAWHLVRLFAMGGDPVTVEARPPAPAACLFTIEGCPEAGALDVD